MKPSRAHPKNGAGRRRDAARTRDALIAAGTGLFAERGYDGVPVATIAAKARVNKAMINYHFGGKRNLYVAIVSATFSEIVSRVEALADSSRPAPDLLRDLVAIVGDTATRRSPHFCTMMLREVLSGGKHLELAVLAKPARVLGAVQRIVERGVREGTLRPVDPVLTHLSIVGSLVFFFATAGFRERVLSSRRPLGLKPPTPAAYVNHLQEMITHGLAIGAAARGGHRRAEAGARATLRGLAAHDPVRTRGAFDRARAGSPQAPADRPRRSAPRPGPGGDRRVALLPGRARRACRRDCRERTNRGGRRLGRGQDVRADPRDHRAGGRPGHGRTGHRRARRRADPRPRAAVRGGRPPGRGAAQGLPAPDHRAQRAASPERARRGSVARRRPGPRRRGRGAPRHRRGPARAGRGLVHAGEVGARRLHAARRDGPRRGDGGQAEGEHRAGPGGGRHGGQAPGRGRARRHHDRPRQPHQPGDPLLAGGGGPGTDPPGPGRHRRPAGGRRAGARPARGSAGQQERPHGHRAVRGHRRHAHGGAGGSGHGGHARRHPREPGPGLPARVRARRARSGACAWASRRGCISTRR